MFSNLLSNILKHLQRRVLLLTRPLLLLPCCLRAWHHLTKHHIAISSVPELRTRPFRCGCQPSYLVRHLWLQQQNWIKSVSIRHRNSSQLHSFHLRDSIYHVKSHLNGIPSMITARFWQTWYTVVAVSKDLNPKAVVLLSWQNNLLW